MLGEWILWMVLGAADHVKRHPMMLREAWRKSPASTHMPFSDYLTRFGAWYTRAYQNAVLAASEE